MKPLSSFLILFGILISAVAQIPDKTANRAAKEVREVELARFDAQVRGDTEKLKLFLADELKYTHSSAKTETKDEFLKALSSGIKYLSIEPSQMDVNVYDQTAVITGQAAVKVEAGGRQRSFSIKYTDVYIWREKRWQMVAWQSTRLEDQWPD